MTESGKESRRLSERFEGFQTLHPIRDSETRKNRVRELEAQVKSGEITISRDQVQRFLAGDHELARILVHLLIENGKVNSDQQLCRTNILSEWELLKRRELSHDASRMPLYYAVRAYLTRLTGAPDSRAAAVGDRFFIREIDTALSKSELDRNSTLRERVAELLSILESADSSSSHPTILAAIISRKSAIVAAAIAASAAIAVGLMTNWDKITSSSAQKASPAPATKK